MKPLKSSDPRLLKEVGDLSLIDIFPICVICLDQCLYIFLEKNFPPEAEGLRREKRKKGRG
ncbi:hypothetical protein AA650_22560 [Anabaena sp. WA102]|nr:hypothetical protein AA650_22560 [Anabaena sp. WA102]